MNDILSVDRFESVTILITVMDETISLEETVKIVLRDAKDDINEILFVVCKRTTPEAMATIDRLSKSLGNLARVHTQTLPFLGGAIREGFDLARGSHVIMMASDLETDPNEVKNLIANAKAHPSAIITTTRWRSGKKFEGYSPIKLIFNWIFQKFFAILYGVQLSDMTFGYRIFPTKLVQSIRWEELRHAFLFETLVKPLRLGIEVIEIPCGWKARIEGRSWNSFFLNFVYFRTGLRTRFASRKSILKPGIQA